MDTEVCKMWGPQCAWPVDSTPTASNEPAGEMENVLRAVEEEFLHHSRMFLKSLSEVFTQRFNRNRECAPKLNLIAYCCCRWIIFVVPSVATCF